MFITIFSMRANEFLGIILALVLFHFFLSRQQSNGMCFPVEKLHHSEDAYLVEPPHTVSVIQSVMLLDYYGLLLASIKPRNYKSLCCSFHVLV